jgi:hypothetical protein
MRLYVWSVTKKVNKYKLTYILFFKLTAFNHMKYIQYYNNFLKIKFLNPIKSKYWAELNKNSMITNW